ncbi:hypothetical protein ACMWQD_29250, partial [Escherichia coli]|uniref:hypothetical protein n=1 Tax=Escherichia coli TaxID=562 RepID=UPI0039DF4D4F
MENRQTMRPEFMGLSRDEIKAKLLAGESITQDNPRNVLTYTGDTTVQDVAEYDQAELLIHECTFLNREDV